MKMPEFSYKRVPAEGPLRYWNVQRDGVTIAAVSPKSTHVLFRHADHENTVKFFVDAGFSTRETSEGIRIEGVDLDVFNKLFPGAGNEEKTGEFPLMKERITAPSSSDSENRSSWIRSLRLGNFKAIGKTQEIPLKPLTLIFGPNSAGKSSVLHGLLLAHHAMHSREANALDAHRVELGGDSVDLGGFRQYVHRHRVDSKVAWSAEVSIDELDASQEAQQSGTLKRLLEIVGNCRRARLDFTWGVATDDRGRVKSGASPEVVSYEVFFDDDEALRASRRPDGTMRIDVLDHKHSVFEGIIEGLLLSTTTTGELDESDKEAVGTAIAELLTVLSVKVSGLLPIGIKRPEDERGTLQQMSFFPVSKGNRAEDLGQAAKFWAPRILDELIRGLHDAVDIQFRKLRYLGPLRSYPPRHMAFAQHHDLNWYAGGGHAWDVVLRNDQVRENVNTWLGDAERLQTPYRLEIRQLTPLEGLSDLMTQAIEEEQDRPQRLKEELAKLQAEYQMEDSDLETLTSYVRRSKEIQQLTSRAKGLKERMVRMDEKLYKGSLESDVYDLLMEEREQILVDSQEAEEQLQAAEVSLKDIRQQFNAVRYRRGDFDIQAAAADLEAKVKEKIERISEIEEQIQSLEEEPLMEKDPGEMAAQIMGRVLATDSEALRELVLKDLRTGAAVSHRDVGIGVSQVLPVLVSAYAGSGQMIAIEQPEIHLHPRLQAELGDVLIESALGRRRNTFLLETHSEALILRIMRRMRNTDLDELPEGLPPVTPDDVAVLYVYPREDGESAVLELRLDEEGKLIDQWPGGFFEEGFKERFS